MVTKKSEKTIKGVHKAIRRGHWFALVGQLLYFLFLLLIIVIQLAWAGGFDLPLPNLSSFFRW